MICAERRLALHQFGKPGRDRIGRHRRNVGEDATRSTTTTFACRAISRASVSAVSVMLSLDARAEHGHLARRGAAPASVSATLLDFAGFRRGIHRAGIASRLDQFRLGDSSASTAGAAEARARSPARAPAPAERRTYQAQFRAQLPAQAASRARGAVMRNSSPVAIAPEVSSKVASVAISTIGSFFG